MSLNSDRIKELDFIHKLADSRMSLHSNHKSSRPLSVDYEFIGLLGEWEFSKITKLPMDTSLRPSGDRGIDFKIGILTIDIKTARLAYNLLRERNKPHANVLVLARYIEKDSNIVFLGWEFDHVMLQQPYKDFGYGIINHYKAVELLKPMDKLYSTIKMLLDKENKNVFE